MSLNGWVGQRQTVWRRGWGRGGIPGGASLRGRAALSRGGILIMGWNRHYVVSSLALSSAYVCEFCSAHLFNIHFREFKK